MNTMKGFFYRTGIAIKELGERMKCNFLITFAFRIIDFARN